MAPKHGVYSTVNAAAENAFRRCNMKSRNTSVRDLTVEATKALDSDQRILLCGLKWAELDRDDCGGWTGGNVVVGQIGRARYTEFGEFLSHHGRSIFQRAIELT